MTRLIAAASLLILLLAACGGPGGAENMYRGYETPEWTVEAREGDFEVRRYAPHLAAEVTLEASPDAALRQGFRILAGYIFGKNDGGAKIAMTSPVTREAAGAKIDMTSPVTRESGPGGTTVRFMLPSAYARETLPAPEDPRIRIVEVDPGRRAVLAFSGWATEARIDAKAAELGRIAAARGLRLDGAVEAAWYDDPFTLPWRRRNEVSRRIAE